MPGDDALGLHGRDEEPDGDRSLDGAGAGAEDSRSGVEAHAVDCWPQAVALSRHARLRSVVEPTCVMATRFSSNATVQVPRLLIALSIVVSIAGAFSLTISGSGVCVVLAAAVVFRMGTLFQRREPLRRVGRQNPHGRNSGPAGFRVWEDKCLRGCTPRVFHL